MRQTLKWDTASETECWVAHWDLLTICSITPAVTPPAILKAAGKLSRPAPRAALTTMKTAPREDTPLFLLSSVSRSWLDSTLGLCSSQALSPELMVPAPPHSSTFVLIAISHQRRAQTKTESDPDSSRGQLELTSRESITPSVNPEGWNQLQLKFLSQHCIGETVDLEWEFVHLLGFRKLTVGCTA